MIKSISNITTENFRRLFFGASFIKNKNWGLKKIILNQKILLQAIWDK